MISHIVTGFYIFSNVFSKVQKIQTKSILLAFFKDFNLPHWCMFCIFGSLKLKMYV